MKAKKPNNAEILSAGSKIYAKKRKRKQETVESVEFDFDARKYAKASAKKNIILNGSIRDFLTGFHKRKVERKKKTIEKYKEKARQEKIKARAEARAERQRMADKNVAEVAAMLRGAIGEDDDDQGFPEEENEQIEDVKEPNVKQFKSKSALTTVTVIEDLDLDEP